MAGSLLFLVPHEPLHAAVSSSRDVDIVGVICKTHTGMGSVYRPMSDHEIKSKMYCSHGHHSDVFHLWLLGIAEALYV